MPKIVMYKGLPASGKSTKALQVVRSDNSWVRINKDAIRAMLHGGRRSRRSEEEVIAARDALLDEFMRRGRNIIIDDTNFNPVHRRSIEGHITRFHAAGGTHHYELDEEFFEVDVDEAIRRDLARADSVGEQVIRKMYREYLQPAVPAAAVTPDPKLPWAIICDLDGTLARMVERGPFEFDKCGTDLLNQNVAQTLANIALNNSLTDRFQTVIIIMSGRDDSCRAQTEAWLCGYDVPYDLLLMRTTGDKRKDSIVKRELFEDHLRGRYNISYVLDDRQQVVDMWRHELGLQCFQVAEGNF